MPQTAAPTPVSIPGVALLFGITASAALFRALTYPFRTIRAPTLRNDVFFAALRTILYRITIAQTRYLTISTTKRYLSFCEQQGVQPHTLEVNRKDGAGKVVAHWVGKPDADAVVFCLHGGGYTQSMTESHFHYFSRLVADLNGPGRPKDIALLVLAYSLAPEATYPTQLQEAATIMDHLLNETGRSPADIFVTGDSAGGNLSLSLLSHILHPRHGVPEIRLSSPLAGALLYSPWVTFRTDHDSFMRNVQTDMLPATMLRRWAAMFLGKSNPHNPEADPGPGPVTGDSYSEPASNHPSWWNGLNNVVSDIFVWVGGDEVFVDAIRAFGNDLKEGWADGGGQAERVTFLETPRKAHVGLIMDIMVDSKAKSEHQLAVEGWYKARLGQ